MEADLQGLSNGPSSVLYICALLPTLVTQCSDYRDATRETGTKGHIQK